MAQLKCRMCGGTMDVDRKENLAVCPYCGSRSLLYERDEKLYEQFQHMFRALLNQESDQEKTEEGFWVEAEREELVRQDGQTVEISYLMKDKADLCTMYVARNHVIYVFPRGYEDYAERYRTMTGQIQYPNPEMEKELSRYVPKVTADYRLRDGSTLVAVEKEEGVYPLKLLGMLLDRHVAWIVSRMENLCCLLSYNQMVHNGLTIDNLFVSPAMHQLYLYGGWWFAGYEGRNLPGISGDARKYAEKRYLEKKKCHPSTDLEAMRYAAVRLLGYESREELGADAPLPEPFRRFLKGPAERDAGADFARWDQVLLKSYGERKFIPLSVTEEELYSKDRKEE